MSVGLIFLPHGGPGSEQCLHLFKCRVHVQERMRLDVAERKERPFLHHLMKLCDAGHVADPSPATVLASEEARGLPLVAIAIPPGHEAITEGRCKYRGAQETAVG